MSTHHTFAEWLHQQREGHAHAELSAKLSELAQQAIDFQGTAELTLKLTLKGSGRQLLVTDAITTKPPKAPKSISVFFHDPEGGGLSRKDPQQTELPLVDLEEHRSKQPLREIDREAV